LKSDEFDEGEWTKNTILNLPDTLKTLSCSELQISYKHAVLYVHVPIELMTQWDNYGGFIKESNKFKTSKVFRALFTDDQIDGMRQFDQTVNAYWEKYKNKRSFSSHRVLDVPQILENKGWMNLMADAGQLYDKLRSLFEEYEIYE
jgi:hypothetical protein